MSKDILKILFVFILGSIFGFIIAPQLNNNNMISSGLQVKNISEPYSCAVAVAESSTINKAPIAETSASNLSTSSTHLPTVSGKSQESNQSERFMQLAATRLIEDISKYSQLSQQQKDQIMEKGGQIAREFWSPDRNSETLKQILGEQDYQQYNEVLSMQRIKFQQDNIEKEVLFYGRKLKLNESQENDLRSAFAQAQAQASELAHNPDSSGKDFASNFQQRREQIRNSVLEQMQNGLSAEQLQELQQEMEASERFWGRW